MYLIKFSILGNISIVIGLMILYALPPVIEIFLNSQLILEPGSKTYPMWESVPVPIYQKFYFFNVTNAQEIEQFGHKPHLQEIGPFTYRAEWTKRDIDLDSDKSTINFKHIKQWHFEPSMSVASDRQTLVTLNAPLAITLTLIQSASNAVRLLVTFSLDGLSEGFFTRRSVRQLLFDGYPDLLTTFGPLLNAEMLSQGGHFGYMNARNNSIDGQYQINSGAEDISKLNTIELFNGRRELSYWSKRHGGKCNSLEGATTGEIFPPIKENQTTVRLFQPDFCRVWPLELDKSFEHPSGLKLKRFVASRDIFRNSTDLPENRCYFSSPGSHHHAPNGHQHSGGAAHRQSPSSNNINRPLNAQQHNRVRHEWPAGVFTLAPCKFHAPIYLSMPHFLDADPSFGGQVSGLDPDRSKHEFYLNLEPRTGSPIEMSARVQINVAISRPPGLVRFRQVPEIMFPIFWQELSVQVNEPIIRQLLMMGVPQKLAYVFLMLGCAILTITVLFAVHKERGN